MNDLSDENMRDIFRAGFDNLTLRSHWKAIVAFARAAIAADRALNAPVAQAAASFDAEWLTAKAGPT